MSLPTQRPEVTAALLLIAQGIPLRAAARQMGVSKTTLVTARKKAGAAPLPRGRPAVTDHPTTPMPLPEQSATSRPPRLLG